MAVLTALRTAGRTVVRNPIVLVVTTVLGLTQIPQLLLQSADPLVSGLVSLGVGLFWFVALPFVHGGIIGLVDDAIDGATDFGTFLAAGKRHYLSLLGVYIVLFGLNFALGIVAFFAGIFGIGGLLVAGGGSHSPLLLGGVAVIALLAVGAYFLVMFFIQFYGQAIVVDGVGAVEGVKRSVRVVRENLLGTLGYSLVSGVVGAGFGLLGAGYGILTTPASVEAFGLPPISTALTVGGAVLLVVVTGLVGGLLATFSVSFYREIRPPVSARHH
jgi:hypothetical protein